MRSITETGRSSADVIVIGAMAGVIIGLLDKTGLGQGLTLILSAVGQNNLVVLLGLTAVISIILGMGMPTSAIYLLLATMIAPSLVHLGVHPIAAHMFVLYFGLMSMITPPVALAAFAAASLAGANAMATGFTAVRLGWIAYVIPFVFVLSPALLMQGDAIHIAIGARAGRAGSRQATGSPGRRAGIAITLSDHAGHPALQGAARSQRGARVATQDARCRTG